MTELKKIKSYIQKTSCNRSKGYDIGISEMKAIADLDLFYAIGLAFNYGQAKGYREAMAKKRK